MSLAAGYSRWVALTGLVLLGFAGVANAQTPLAYDRAIDSVIVTRVASAGQEGISRAAIKSYMVEVRSSVSAYDGAAMDLSLRHKIEANGVLISDELQSLNKAADPSEGGHDCFLSSPNCNANGCPTITYTEPPLLRFMQCATFTSLSGTSYCTCRDYWVKTYGPFDMPAGAVVAAYLEPAAGSLAELYTDNDIKTTRALAPGQTASGTLWTSAILLAGAMFVLIRRRGSWGAA